MVAFALAGASRPPLRPAWAMPGTPATRDGSGGVPRGCSSRTAVHELRVAARCRVRCPAGHRAGGVPGRKGGSGKKNMYLSRYATSAHAVFLFGRVFPGGVGAVTSQGRGFNSRTWRIFFAAAAAIPVRGISGLSPAGPQACLRLLDHPLYRVAGALICFVLTRGCGTLRLSCDPVRARTRPCTGLPGFHPHIVFSTLLKCILCASVHCGSYGRAQRGLTNKFHWHCKLALTLC